MHQCVTFVSSCTADAPSIGCVCLSISLSLSLSLSISLSRSLALSLSLSLSLSVSLFTAKSYRYTQRVFSFLLDNVGILNVCLLTINKHGSISFLCFYIGLLYFQCFRMVFNVRSMFVQRVFSEKPTARYCLQYLLKLKLIVTTADIFTNFQLLLHILMY